MPARMLALIFDGSKPRLEEILRPRPGPDEALVAVRLAGICRTDLEIVRGYMGFRGVMGHEYVGELAEGPPALVGRRVVGEINFSCGACPTCLAGRSRHCPTRSVLGIAGHDGCFAEYTAVPISSLHLVPDGVDDEAAVFVEPLAAALRILEQVALPSTGGGTGDWPEPVVVLGDGRLGLLAGLVLRARAPVLLVGRHPSKLALARTLGLDAMHVDAFVPGAQTPLVVEATGRPEGLALALRAVRPLGTIVLKSTFATPGGLDLAPVVVGEVTIVGSRCGPFPPAIAALAEGLVDPRPLVTARLPLARGLEALDLAAQGASLKVLLEPPGAGSVL
jgi:threonine dehydrogenase-like Zn-dependent dehydrogenase